MLFFTFCSKSTVLTSHCFPNPPPTEDVIFPNASSARVLSRVKPHDVHPMFSPNSGNSRREGKRTEFATLLLLLPDDWIPPPSDPSAGTSALSRRADPVLASLCAQPAAEPAHGAFG